MSQILVLYYSTYGHMETMAEAVAEGVRSAGASVDVKWVGSGRVRRCQRGHHVKGSGAAGYCVEATTCGSGTAASAAAFSAG